MNGALKKKTTSGEVDDSSQSNTKKFLISKENCGAVSMEEWIMEIGFIKRVGKGWITKLNVKDFGKQC